MDFLTCDICDGKTGVLETRGARRMRRCDVCGSRFSTVEVRADEMERFQKAQVVAERLKRGLTNLLNTLDEPVSVPASPQPVATTEEGIPYSAFQVKAIPVPAAASQMLEDYKSMKVIASSTIEEFDEYARTVSMQNMVQGEDGKWRLKLEQNVEDSANQTSWRKDETNPTTGFLYHDFGQWAVTEHGLENTNGPYRVILYPKKLANRTWFQHYIDKAWVNTAEFIAAWNAACKHHGIEQ